uniref:G domain-containing protein n=1 Tax=Glossina pallidipes TaxID=7398 RepID=A0A1A9ZJN9_GLOPL
MEGFFRVAYQLRILSGCIVGRHARYVEMSTEEEVLKTLMWAILLNAANYINLHQKTTKNRCDSEILLSSSLVNTISTTPLIPSKRSANLKIRNRLNDTDSQSGNDKNERNLDEKTMQEVALDSKITLIDCPGIVLTNNLKSENVPAVLKKKKKKKIAAIVHEDVLAFNVDGFEAMKIDILNKFDVKEQDVMKVDSTGPVESKIRE